MKNYCLTLLLCLIGSGLLAQSFAPRILDFSRKKASFLTLKDGTEVIGHFKGGVWKKGLFKRITMEDTVSGEKTKYEAEEIAAMRLVPSGWGQLAATSEAATSVTRMQNSDFDALSRDYIYFDQAQLPNKKGTFVLLQVVNPGFDSKVKVFDDPRAKASSGIAVGGVSLTGGNLKSYYLMRDGVAYLVTKSKYSKEFKKIYGDCSFLAENFDKVKWLDFAEHVYAHEQNCQ
jgi:hypothetical protein